MPESAKKIYISLGSNLGDRVNNLSKACELLGERVGKIEKKSKIYQTEPWGFDSRDQFLNQVISLFSNKSARDIIEDILTIENELGRNRTEKKYSSRIIDIDVLFYANEIIKSEKIEVPHPRLHERKFVLIPLLEIALDFVHPVFKKSIQLLLMECKDELYIKKFGV